MDTLRQKIEPGRETSLALVPVDTQFTVAPVGALVLGEEELPVAPANLPAIVRGLSTSFRNSAEYPVNTPFDRVALQVEALSLVVAAVRNAANARGHYFRTQLFTRDSELPGQQAAKDARLPEDGIVASGDELLILIGQYGLYNGGQQQAFRDLHIRYEAAVETGNRHTQLAVQDMESIVRQRTDIWQNPPKGRILGDFERELKEKDVAETRASLLARLETAIPGAHDDAANQREAMRQIITSTEGLSDKLASDVLRRVMDFVARYSAVVETTRLVAGDLRERAQVVLDAPNGLSASPRSPQGGADAISGQAVGEPREVPSILNIVKDQG